jgi:hypothetical protein
MFVHVKHVLEKSCSEINSAIQDPSRFLFGQKKKSACSFTAHKLNIREVCLALILKCPGILDSRRKENKISDVA